MIFSFYTNEWISKSPLENKVHLKTILIALQITILIQFKLLDMFCLTKTYEAIGTTCNIHLIS